MMIQRIAEAQGRGIEGRPKPFPMLSSYQLGSSNLIKSDPRIVKFKLFHTISVTYGRVRGSIKFVYGGM